MLRTVLTLGAVALLGIFALKLLFGVGSAFFALFFWLFFIAVRVAIVGALVYLFVVEGIISSIPATQGLYKWLPGGALEAMTATFNQTDLLSAWQGGLVLLVYALVFSVLGTLFAVRRDVV